MTSYHRLAGAGREAGAVLCSSAAEGPHGAASKPKLTKIMALGQRKSQNKHPSDVPAWRARQALHFREGGKLHGRYLMYLMILFLNCTSQFPQGWKMGLLEGEGGVEIHTIETSACPHSCLLSVPGVALPGFGGTRWHKASSAMQINPCSQSVPTPLPMSLDPMASPWWPQKQGREKYDTAESLRAELGCKDPPSLVLIHSKEEKVGKMDLFLKFLKIWLTLKEWAFLLAAWLRCSIWGLWVFKSWLICIGTKFFVSGAGSAAKSYSRPTISLVKPCSCWGKLFFSALKFLCAGPLSQSVNSCSFILQLVVWFLNISGGKK